MAKRKQKPKPGPDALVMMLEHIEREMKEVAEYLNLLPCSYKLTPEQESAMEEVRLTSGRLNDMATATLEECGTEDTNQ